MARRATRASAGRAPRPPSLPARPRCWPRRGPTSTLPPSRACSRVPRGRSHGSPSRPRARGFSISEPQGRTRPPRCRQRSASGGRRRGKAGTSRGGSSCGTCPPAGFASRSPPTGATEAARAGSSSGSPRRASGYPPAGSRRSTSQPGQSRPSDKAVEGQFTIRPEGSTAIHVPWLITVQPRRDELISALRISTRSVQPVRHRAGGPLLPGRPHREGWTARARLASRPPPRRPRTARAWECSPGFAISSRAATQSGSPVVTPRARPWSPAATASG